MRRLIQGLGQLLFQQVDRSGAAEVGSPFEQFAVPYQFQPKLTLGEAVVAASLAVLRIFLGSLLFAVWGAYSILAWNRLQNVFERALVLLMLFAAFLAALGALLIAINAVSRMISNKLRLARV